MIEVLPCPLDKFVIDFWGKNTGKYLSNENSYLIDCNIFRLQIKENMYCFKLVFLFIVLSVVNSDLDTNLDIN